MAKTADRDPLNNKKDETISALWKHFGFKDLNVEQQQKLTQTFILSILLRFCWIPSSLISPLLIPAVGHETGRSH